MRKHVFGAGYGGYTATPDLHDGSWTVQFVRGPQTARRLQLAPKLALADPAILVRLAAPMEPVAGHEVSFMPHWQSMQRGHWDIACKLAGITLIDPRRPVDEVLGLMRGSRLLIAEATQIAPIGQGYPHTPGIYSDNQVAGWKLVTQAVHEKGGKQHETPAHHFLEHFWTRISRR